MMCKRIFASQTVPTGDVPFYKIGTIGSSPDAYISFSLYNEYKKQYSFPLPGETLITCSGTVGRCVRYDGAPAYYQDSNIVWMRNKTDIISKDFLFWLLKKHDWSTLNTTTISRIYSSDLLGLTLNYPESRLEQDRISKFFDLIERRIELQSKIIEELELLRKRLSDSLIRVIPHSFTRISLKDRLKEYVEKNEAGFPVYSVSVQVGVVNQVEHLGRSFAAKETKHYRVARFGDLIYTKSPTGFFPYGIIKQSQIDHPVAVSPLYGVYRPLTYEIGFFLHCYFSNETNANNYLHPLVDKGAKNTMNISNQHFLDGFVSIPLQKEEKTICRLLAAIEKKLLQGEKIKEAMVIQKRFLLNNMFI